MAGHSGERGVRLAHADSATVSVGVAADSRVSVRGLDTGTARSGLPVDRGSREALEDLLLVPGATRAEGSGRRARSEPADPLRTCFERDRDRILHSSAFRRLAGKTQVFVFPDDHQRTRLTHALEVAQVAVAVAEATGLNRSLVEAIALGHDCGHGPGGHASEDALAPYVPGGFDHAVWGADVVLAPLNLTEEVLDGIRNHSWSRPAPSTPEAEVVSWADRCAYTAHDLEDAVSAGIVTLEMLPAVVTERAGRTRSAQLRAFITDLVHTISTTGTVGMSEDMAEALAHLRAFDYEHIYLRPASEAQAAAVIEVMRALVEHFADRPHLLADGDDDDAGPGGGARRPAGDGADGSAVDAGRGSAVEAGSGSAMAAGGDEAVRRAVAYVGGMTDRFAFRSALALLDWDPTKLPRGIDTSR